VPIVCDNPNVKQLLQQHLEGNGIQTRNYFAGNLLLHPAYRHLGSAKDFPNAYEVLKRVFFLGTSPALTYDDIAYVGETIHSFMVTTPISCDGYSCKFAV
jgi:CDP-4-dehydro-6-deoxyglucose reductase, E1